MKFYNNVREDSYLQSGGKIRECQIFCVSEIRDSVFASDQFLTYTL